MIRKGLEKAATAVMVALTLPFWVLGQQLGSDNDTSGPDLSGDNDRITDFEATETDPVEYRPIEDTLERAAESTTEYNVYTERRVEINPGRLEEWVRANYDDETRVDIQTKHGMDVYTRGELIDHECPVCGDSALVKTSDGQRQWVHIGRGETCTIGEVPDGQS